MKIRKLAILAFATFWTPGVAEAMCLATPCYEMEVSVSDSRPDEQYMKGCLVSGQILSSKVVSCAGSASNPVADHDSKPSSPPNFTLLNSHLERTAVDSRCEEIIGKNFLVHVFQDCCDIAGRKCIRGYQLKELAPLP